MLGSNSKHDMLQLRHVIPRYVHSIQKYRHPIPKYMHAIPRYEHDIAPLQYSMIFVKNYYAIAAIRCTGLDLLFTD
jgi:hypothetical protein